MCIFQQRKWMRITQWDTSTGGELKYKSLRGMKNFPEHEQGKMRVKQNFTCGKSANVVSFIFSNRWKLIKKNDCTMNCALAIVFFFCCSL